MKKTILVLLVILVLILSVFIGCKELLGMSKEDRVKEFAKALNNSNRNAMIKEHFHPSGSYYGMSDAELANDFPKGSGYSASNVSVSGNNVTATINGPASKPNWTFNMKEDGKDDWKINSYN